MQYTLFKLIHVLGVVLFLGNIITGVFWMMIAVRTRDVRIIAHSMRGIIQADRLFTLPGIVIITVGGVLAALQGHLPMLRTGWILWGIVLFGISGVAFMWKVGPLQRTIYSYVTSQGDAMDWNKFMKLFNQWSVWGTIATLAPLIALALMVLKIPA